MEEPESSALLAAVEEPESSALLAAAAEPESSALLVAVGELAFSALLAAVEEPESSALLVAVEEPESSALMVAAAEPGFFALLAFSAELPEWHQALRLSQHLQPHAVRHTLPVLLSQRHSLLRYWLARREKPDLHSRKLSIADKAGSLCHAEQGRQCLFYRMTAHTLFVLAQGFLGVPGF